MSWAGDLSLSVPRLWMNEYPWLEKNRAAAGSTTSRFGGPNKPLRVARGCEEAFEAEERGVDEVEQAIVEGEEPGEEEAANPLDAFSQHAVSQDGLELASLGQQHLEGVEETDDDALKPVHGQERGEARVLLPGQAQGHQVGGNEGPTAGVGQDKVEEFSGREGGGVPAQCVDDLFAGLRRVKVFRREFGGLAGKGVGGFEGKDFRDSEEVPHDETKDQQDHDGKSHEPNDFQGPGIGFKGAACIWHARQ